MATWPTITDDSGDNTSGTIVNNTNVWTPVQTYIGGAGVNRTFSAADFAGSGSMTVTVASGDVSTDRYRVIAGKTVIWDLLLSGISIGGTPSTQILINLPPTGTIAASTIHCAGVRANDNGTVRSANLYLVSGTAYVIITRDDGANWTASTDNTYIGFQLMFEIA